MGLCQEAAYVGRALKSLRYPEECTQVGVESTGHSSNTCAMSRKREGVTHFISGVKRREMNFSAFFGVLAQKS